MELSSALELKRELVALTRDQALRRHLDGADRRVTAYFARRPHPKPVLPATSGVAIGVAPQKGRKRGYKLAVRVLDRGSAISDSLLRALPPLKDDELDLARAITYRPRLTLRAGGSCGHFRITAGTLGGFVEDHENYYILSNNHVLADTDAGVVGDEIWQPGPIDVSNGRHTVIGHLAKALPLKFIGTDSIDAAIATFSESAKWFDPWTYKGIGGMNPRVFNDRFAVDRVVKLGRTTRVTTGQVSAFDLDGVQVDYGTEHVPRVVTFDGQMEFVHANPTKPFSQPGDSGSFILDARTLMPVALLYAGGRGADGVDRTLAHFMPTVLNALGVRFIR